MIINDLVSLIQTAAIFFGIRNNVVLFSKQHSVGRVGEFLMMCDIVILYEQF